MTHSNPRIEALQLLDRAIELQASRHPDLAGAAKYLKQALALDPHNLELLQAAAGLYAAMQDADQARRCALACKSKASEIVEEMDRILGSQRKKQPPARHIGGIIGPY